MTGPVTTEALVEPSPFAPKPGLSALGGAEWLDAIAAKFEAGGKGIGPNDHMAASLRKTASEVRAIVAAHQQVTAERDEADRRAGAAEREAESDRESTRKRNSWLHQAKLQAGYSTGVSFDKVWAETLEKAGSADTATAEAASLRAEVEALKEEHARYRASAEEMWETAKRHGGRMLAEKRRADMAVAFLATANAELARLRAEVEALAGALEHVKAWIDTDLPAGTSRAGTVHRAITNALDRTALAARAATAREG